MPQNKLINGFDSAIVGGICSVCSKYFRNNRRKINIAIDVSDGKLYCKKCALGKAWNTFKHTTTTEEDVNASK